MATTASIHKNRTTTLGRINGFISTDNIFASENLPAKLYPEVAELTSITVWPMPGGSGSWKNFTFPEIIEKDFIPAKIGDFFGPMWSTHWFRIDINVPAGWTGQEVHLLWDCSSEATLWDFEGNILQGLTSTGIREEYVISRSWTGSQPITYYVEMSCYNLLGNGDLGSANVDITPPHLDKHYELRKAHIALFDREVFNLLIDFEMINGIANQMPDSHKGFQALYAANEMVNLIKRKNNEGARQVSSRFFADSNGAKAHTLYSMGHCHIDTAWLWPYNESIRKSARSFASQIELMKAYPEYKFVCSAAQHLAWVQEYYPGLFETCKEYVVKGQFILVGAVWVEMDGNIPNGESFIRQFFYGQRYFQKEFGIRCKEFWLPDTFGYSPQIPQMMQHVGINRFVTQKLSWSIVNKFPSHNFHWEGIDGSKVLVHFPPGDSYKMNVTVQELLHSRDNSEDKGRSNIGMYLYGVGDGGGGPTYSMVERQIKAKDVDGLPKLVMKGPNEFFDELEKDSKKLSKWVGELYLELHNGTYTSQALTKWYNRKGEFLFKEVELALTIAYGQKVIQENETRLDMEEIDNCWKDFLLNQFHDVLPGTSYEMVHIEAWDIYRNIFTKLMDLRAKYWLLILGEPSSQDRRIIFNPLSWSFKLVIFNLPASGELISGENIQQVVLDTEEIPDSIEGRYKIPNRFSAALVQINAAGFTQFEPVEPSNPVVYLESDNSLNSGLIRIVVELLGDLKLPQEVIYFQGSDGKELEVYKDRLGSETIPGMFYIYDDIPLFWDAWDVMDYHLETRKIPNFMDIGNLEVISEGPIIGISKWQATFGNSSTLTRYTILRADTKMIEYYLVVDWKEDHKFLKVEFPVDILSLKATYEIQYGFVERETNTNTSWQMAKFEVCGHKWMDISQADKGVTFITDSKYGWCVRDNIVKLSLLRSPKNPDANCDMHKHFIHYAVLPHEGTFQESEVVKRAYEMNIFGSNNVPLLFSDIPDLELPKDWITISGNGSSVIVEAFKVAHDLVNTFCVRFYESHGGCFETRITFGFNITKVEVCNGLEEILHPPIIIENNSFSIKFKPFEIKSFLVSL